MRQAMFTKLAATAVLALGALGVAQAAHARTDVYFSVGVPAPVYAPPAYEVAPPAQVYVTPGDEDWRWRREEWRREQWRREQWRREQWRRWHYAHRHYWNGRDWD